MRNTWLKTITLALTLALVAACGRSIDAKKLQGSWKLEKIEGNGYAPEGFRLTETKFIPELSASHYSSSSLGRADNGSNYKVDGADLIVEPNADAGYAGFKVEVESVDDQRLIIKKDGLRVIYRRQG